MELASLLAGEEFSDHPMSVCPGSVRCCGRTTTRSTTTAGQDLYAYASKVVGSRSSGAVQDARAGRLSEWDKKVRQRQREQTQLPWGLRTLNRLLRTMLIESHPHAFYRLTVHDEQTHAEVLALVDELLAITPERAQEAAARDALDALEPLRVPSQR